MDEDQERDYVLGTDDTEVQRLRLQHEAWRPMATACWQRAGIKPGDRVLDVGAGPGWAALDLARIVGPEGFVTAIERSHRFIAAGEREMTRQCVRNMRFHRQDLKCDPLPAGQYDAAWCRWVCSFLEDPRALVEGLGNSVRPGGVAAFHEYADYGSWRYSPPFGHLDRYIELVMASWREAGGEPDVAMSLVPLLDQAGFVIESASPLVYCVHPGDPLWTWIATFVASNAPRLREFGASDEGWLTQLGRDLEDAERLPALMVTPMVMEIIARRQ